MKTSYFTKLTGTSFRQKEIAELKPEKTPLRIIAQDDNKFDPFACEVQALLSDGWTQIGWIAKGSNQSIHEFIKSGGTVQIDLKDVTGQDKDTLGVNVAITYGEDDSVNIDTLSRQTVDFGDEPFIYFDEKNHIAYDSLGHKLISGSEMEHKYSGEADLTYAAKAIAKKTGLKAEDVMATWDAKGEISRMFGTLLHRAIELRLLLNHEMNSIDEYKDREPSPMHWMPDGVWQASSKLEKILFEDRGYDLDKFHMESRLKWKNLTGIADLIYCGDDGYHLFDYKTNQEIKDVKYSFGKATQYTVQQNTYRTMLEHSGYPVVSMELLHWDGKKWNIIPLKEINLEEEIIEW